MAFGVGGVFKGFGLVLHGACGHCLPVMIRLAPLTACGFCLGGGCGAYRAFAVVGVPLRWRVPVAVNDVHPVALRVGGVPECRAPTITWPLRVSIAGNVLVCSTWRWGLVSGGGCGAYRAIAVVGVPLRWVVGVVVSDVWGLAFGVGGVFKGFGLVLHGACGHCLPVMIRLASLGACGWCLGGGCGAYRTFAVVGVPLPWVVAVVVAGVRHLAFRVGVGFYSFGLAPLGGCGWCLF